MAKGQMAKPLFYLAVVSVSKHRTKPQGPGKLPAAASSPDVEPLPGAVHSALWGARGGTWGDTTGSTQRDMG